MRKIEADVTFTDILRRGLLLLVFISCTGEYDIILLLMLVLPSSTWFVVLRVYGI